MVGVQCAFQQAQDYNLFLLVFVGVITGVGGGVLRDVLSNQKPYIFVKHFYACPTLIGALLCALCWRHLGDIPSMLLGAAVILVLRLCAAHFRWGLPHARRPSGITSVCQKGLCLPRLRQVFFGLAAK